MSLLPCFVWSRRRRQAERPQTPRARLPKAWILERLIWLLGEASGHTTVRVLSRTPRLPSCSRAVALASSASNQPGTHHVKWQSASVGKTLLHDATDDALCTWTPAFYGTLPKPLHLAQLGSCSSRLSTSILINPGSKNAEVRQLLQQYRCTEQSAITNQVPTSIHTNYARFYFHSCS